MYKSLKCYYFTSSYFVEQFIIIVYEVFLVLPYVDKEQKLRKPRDK